MRRKCKHWQVSCSINTPQRDGNHRGTNFKESLGGKHFRNCGPYMNIRAQDTTHGRMKSFPSIIKWPVHCGRCLNFRRAVRSQKMSGMLLSTLNSWTKKRLCNRAWIHQRNQDTATKGDTQFLPHDGDVLERLTNAHIAVISHQSERKIVDNQKLWKKNWETHPAFGMDWSWVCMFISIFGTMIDENETSVRAKWLRKKNMGVWRWGSSLMSNFPAPWSGTWPATGKRTCHASLARLEAPGRGTGTRGSGSPYSCCSCLSWELGKVENVNEHVIIF